MSISDDYIKKYLGTTPAVKQKSTTQQSKTAGGSVADEYINKYNPTVNESYIAKFISDWNDYSKKAQETYQGMDWKSATSGSHDSITEADSDLRRRSYFIRSYMDTHKDDFEEDAYKGFMSQLDEMDAFQSEFGKAFSDAKDYFSQWETEDKYNEHLANQKDYEEKSNYDIDAGQKEIEALEAELQKLKKTNPTPSTYVNGRPYAASQQTNPSPNAYLTGDTMVNSRPYAAGLQAQHEVSPTDSKIGELEKLISQKKQYLNQAKHIQEGITLSSVSGNADFNANSGYSTTAKENPAWWEDEVGDTQYEWINNQNGFRDEYEASSKDFHAKSGASSQSGVYIPYKSPYAEKGYDLLNENEIAIYNYYYAKEGKEKAQEYLDNIQETLNIRKATGMFEEMKGNTAQELIFGVATGLDQFTSNMINLFNTEDDYIAQTAYQIASGMVREDLADDGFNFWYNFKDKELQGSVFGNSVGQTAYDAITTSANMAPSILASAVVGMLNPTAGAAVGNALMGMSAAGGAYQQALNEGFDKGQARGYSILVGGSEMVMEKLLGGISAFGGNALGKTFTKNVANADTALKMIAKRLGGSMISEFSEEYLQEVLDPVFRNIMLKTDEDVKLVSAEAIYSGILGALTAGIMEGPTAIGTEVKNYRTGKKLQAADISATRLAEIGKTFSADSVAHQLAGKVDENTGAYTLGRLFNEIGATLTEQNVNDITNALVAKNIDEATAKKNAQALAYVVEGGQLTDSGVAIIEANTALAEVVRTTIIDANSTVNQRTKGYNEALMALAQETVSPKTSQTKTAEVGKENAHASDKVDTQKENVSETHYEASADGKTILMSTGETVTIKEVATIKNGRMTLRMDDGRVVDASEVSYASADEALVYETVAQMGASVNAANILVNGFKTANESGLSASEYAHGIEEAFRYGKLNDKSGLANSVFASKLNPGQQEYVYRQGQRVAGKQVAKEQATVSKKGSIAATEKTSATGRVHFDRKGRTFDSVREVSLKTMEQLSKALGVEFYVFESYKNENGERVYKDANGNEVTAPNGYYDPKDGSIHIDLNAGADGKGTMLFAIAHELTHFIKQWSPAKFKVLANFLVKQYGEKDVSIDKLVDKQIAKAKKDGKDIDREEAYEEMVADSMETMLTDGNVVQMMAELKQQDKSLWQKICDWFKDLVADLQALVDAYKGVKPDSTEGRMVAQMQDVIVILESLYADALVEASENFQSAEKNTTEDGGVKMQARQTGFMNSSEIQAVQNIGRRSISSLSSTDLAKLEKFAKSYWDTMKTKSPFFRAWFGDWRLNDYKTKVEVARRKSVSANGSYTNSDTGWTINISGQVFSETKAHTDSPNIAARKYLPYIQDIVEKAVLLDSYGMEPGKIKSENSLLMHSLYAIADMGKGPEVIKLYVEEMNNPNNSGTDKRAYQLQNIEKYRPAGRGSQNNASPISSAPTGTGYTVADLAQYVKRKDVDYSPKYPSKIVNADGSPKVMYHGSRAQFDAFDKKKAKSSGTYGKGFYFTDSISHAGTYGNLYEVYLNIQNPVQAGKSSVTKSQVKAFLEAVADNEDYSIENYGTYDVDAVLKNIMGGKSKADAFRVLQDISVTAIGDMVEAVKLFNDVNGTNYDGIVAATETIAFEPTQIKSATDNIGTFDKSNPKFKYSTRNTETSKNPVDYGRIMDMQGEVSRLTREIAEFEETEEFKTKMKEIFGSSDIEKALKDYQEWRKSSGYEGMIEQRDALKKELENARKQFDEYNAEQAANEQKNAIEKSGLSEAEYFRKQAVKEFGYTPYFYDAGYLTPNGKMLNFSGEKGKHFGSRGQDHRAIGIIYENEQGTAAMVRFMNDGNIRIMAETPGLDISSSIEPTKEQYATIKKFAREFGSKGKYFAVDISDNNGRVVGNYEYDGYVNADRVVNDIKYFFENGKVREQSSVANFLQSARDQEAEKVNNVLQKENTKLKEDVKYLKELLKLQRSVTGGTMFTKTSVESAAGLLMKSANAKGDKKELAKLLDGFYGYIAKGEELTWESVVEAAQPAVDWLQSNVETKKQLDTFAADVLRDLRGSRIYLDETQKKEAAYKFGSYNEYRKKMMGTVIFTDKGSISLDSMWHELSELYPSIFDPNTNATDMPEALMDAVDRLRNMDTTAYEYAYDEDMMTQDLIRQVYDTYWNVSTLKTVADVKQKEINRLKGEHSKRMTWLREYHNEKTEQLKKEHKEELKRVRDEYRERAEKKQQQISERYRESRQKAVTKARETAAKRDAKAKLQKLVLDTAKWISHPAKTDVKCPDVLKQPYADFLNNIDMSSERLAKGGDPTKNDLRLANAMGSLTTALERIMTSQDPNQETSAVLDAGYLDLPANFVQKFRDMTEDVKAMMIEGEYVVNTMSAEEVRNLSQMIRTLNHAIKEMSTLYANMRFANVETLGDNSMSAMDALGEIQKTSGMKDFVQWENALPYYAFKRFGDGGQSIFEGLMDAQDKLAFLAKDIFAFQDKTWKSDEAKKWSEDTHTIDLPDGDKLTLTTADAMSIYCLSRRPQGLQHLLGGGVRVMGIQKGSQKAKDSRSVLTIKDIDAINSSLTDRQKNVAEAMQEFMSTTCAEWGNEISMKRFLTKEFNEKFYFPIESNDENMPTRDPSAQQSDLFRLLNISATKAIDPKANNEVIIRNIFDVFTGHASDMARLNAFGMPLLDYMKWLNYREKTVNEQGQINVRGVRKSMETAFGNAAKSYVLNLIKDVNGRASDGGDPSILMKWMRTAKTANVGSSLRVATLQLTSYPRAALVLSPKNLALGLTKLPNIKKAKEYCGIALWKSFGFYDTNISRSIEDQMKGEKDVRQKLIELSLKGAEWGDAITWGALWNACEYEVAATKQYKVGSEEFYQAVGKKLREVVYRTQVVDSTLTRSQIMRSKRGMAQEAAAFMSEPTLSANILMDAGFEFSMEERRTGIAKAAWKKTGKYVGKAVAVYAIGQLTAALLEGIWDAWRDDDDEEFGEKFIDAFVENLVLDLLPFNKIPIVSDVFEAALAMFDVGFYSSDRMSTTWLTQAVSAVDAWKKVLGGESSTTAYNALYKSVRAVSSYYGVSFSGAMREGVALWNNTAGAYDSTLKIRQYEPTKAELGQELYEAIIDGDTRQATSLKAKFDDQKAISSAIRKALRENDPRIREAAIAWNANDLDEYMRIAKQIIAEKHFVQDDVVMAIRSEASELAPDDGETSTSKAKGLFTTEKFAEAISQNDQATAYAIKADIIQTAQKNGKTAEEAEKSFRSDARTELKEIFLAGKLSEQNLISTLVDYCGVEQEEAELDAKAYAWMKRNPQYDLTVNEALAYTKPIEKLGYSIEDSGIDPNTFVEYRELRSECKGTDSDGDGQADRDTVKNEVLEVINNLPITSKQKDALYYLNGWAASKLYKAPWH